MEKLIQPELVLEGLRKRKSEFAQQWIKANPFHYLVIDDFLPLEMAETITDSYPSPSNEWWKTTTYIHQSHKYHSQTNFPEPIEGFFALAETPGFMKLLSEITGIEGLVYDPKLFGGGMHQTLPGGFLDVHVDFNMHPETKLHRRINLLLYLNKNWKPEYEGYIELWDMEAKKQLEYIAPEFNRAVMFETNDISYHGHPKPLKSPPPITRKSLALYYYTKEPGENYFGGLERNSIFKQTTGVQGYVKNFISSYRAFSERWQQQGSEAICKDLTQKLFRRIKGLPPKNNNFSL